MKQETKMKWQRGWLRFKQEMAEIAPCMILGSGVGMLIGGYFGTIKNSKQIGTINKRLALHEKVINNHADIIDQHADAGNKLAARERQMEEEVKELQRQNNLLMEKALQNTKGE